MKVPKYVIQALDRRKKAANAFVSADAIISEFIDKNGIDCEYTHLHCESLCNAHLANNETIEAILSHEKEKD